MGTVCPARTVFDPRTLFLDRDGDGIADAVDFQIHLAQGCETPGVLGAIVDFCAAVGFHTMAMDLPLVTAAGTGDPTVRHHLQIGLASHLRPIAAGRHTRTWVVSGNGEDALAAAVRHLTRPLVYSCARLEAKRLPGRAASTKGANGHAGFLHELFACFPYRIVLLGSLGLETAAEAANFGARLGLEASRLSFPLTVPWTGKMSANGPRIFVGRRSELSGIPGLSAPACLLAEWESGVVLLPRRHDVPDILIYGDVPTLGRTLGWLSRFPMNADDWEVPWLRKLTADLQPFLRGPARRRGTRPREKRVWEFRLDDEREEVLSLLAQASARAGTADAVQVEVAVARPLAARQRLAGQIRGLFTANRRRYRDVHVTVLGAYKPGLSWLTEVVARDLAGTGADRIEIAFQDFGTPGLEEPLRWLQEIHPVGEILARHLSIPKDRISFARESGLDAVYRVRAWRGRRRVYENRHSPAWQGRPYLEMFPRAGRVHPTTGRVRLVVTGREVLNQRVKTPAERIWDIYQGQVLPSLAREAEALLADTENVQGPLFEEVRFDIFVNCPAEWLGVGEERISPLEALHEDLYFVTLDFFGRWLKQKGVRGRSPGRILPVVHPAYRGSGGSMKVVLVHRPPEMSSVPHAATPGIRFTGIRRKNTRVEIGLAMPPPSSPGLERGFAARLRAVPAIVKVLTAGPGPGETHVIASIPDPSAQSARVQGRPRSIPLDRPLGYAEGVRMIRSFAGLAGIRVLEEGRSFQGKRIYSVELTHPCPSRWVSHLKRRLFKPTVFVNCRHHANEVSSTNAALELTRLLASVPRFRRLLTRVNVVINPMENVDGVATLEALMRLTPSDKLHAARYNAAGQEYYGEYFNPGSVFGEARVKPAIWRRWLPDICIDSHGFPSHEWDQPFSGYAPFRFRDFWIPRALIYVYLPHLDARPGSASRRNADTLRAWLARSLSQDRRIRDRNGAFDERYWKYREAWKHDGRRDDGPIACLPLAKHLQRTNYAYRYPHLTTVDLITEVAVETAWGPFLRDCISAHLQADLALIHLLNRLHIRAKKVCCGRGRDVELFWHSDRPLVFW